MTIKKLSVLSLMFVASFPAFSADHDAWKIMSNTFMEIEKFEGHRDANGAKVTDKVNLAGQLFISNSSSKWRYFIEHKESMRNYGYAISGSDNSFIRNRTQLGITRNMYKNGNNIFDLNLTYRKESNDGVTDRNARPSNTLFWLMPSGTYWINEKLAFSFWDAFYHYDNFRADNSYEWESEHGIVYKFNDSTTGRLMVYTDWTFDNDFNKNWEQNQIRGYMTKIIDPKWSISPYFRYFLSERSYDAANTNYVTQRADGGLRIGTEVNYKLNERLTMWAGFAVEKTEWEKPKPNGITSGSDNDQTFYLGQLGVKYLW